MYVYRLFKLSIILINSYDTLLVHVIADRDVVGCLGHLNQSKKSISKNRTGKGILKASELRERPYLSPIVAK